MESLGQRLWSFHIGLLKRQKQVIFFKWSSCSTGQSLCAAHCVHPALPCPAQRGVQQHGTPASLQPLLSLSATSTGNLFSPPRNFSSYRGTFIHRPSTHTALWTSRFPAPPTGPSSAPALGGLAPATLSCPSLPGRRPLCLPAAGEDVFSFQNEERRVGMRSDYNTSKHFPFCKNAGVRTCVLGCGLLRESEPRVWTLRRRSAGGCALQRAGASPPSV